MKFESWRQVVVVAAVVAAAAGVGWLLVGDIAYETLAGKWKSQQQVAQLATTLAVGMTPQQVTQIVKRVQFDRLTLYEDGAVWVIRAPMVLGAQEWLVVVTFEAERVSGVGVRIGDSLKTRPIGAPEDKGRLRVRGEVI